MKTPYQITQCKDTNVHTASFHYYEGLEYAKEKGLKQATEFSQVKQGTHFMVCCGDVVVVVKATDFIEVEREIF